MQCIGCACRYADHGVLGQLLAQLRIATHMTSEIMDKLCAFYSSPVDPAKAMHLASLKEKAMQMGRIAVDNASGIAPESCALDWRGTAAGQHYTCTERDVKPNRYDALYYDERNRLKLLFNTLPAPPLLRLKVGVPVVFIQNVACLNVTNGVQGEVVGFRQPGYAEDDESARQWQLPYAIAPDMVATCYDEVNFDSAWPIVR